MLVLYIFSHKETKVIKKKHPNGLLVGDWFAQNEINVHFKTYNKQLYTVWNLWLLNRNAQMHTFHSGH